MYQSGDGQHTQNIQIKCWKLFAPAWLYSLLWCLDSTEVKQKTKQTKNLNCISACNSLLKGNKNVLFLKQIVTGGEKWILYNNVEQQRSWGKMNHHQTQQRPVFIQRRWSQRRDWKGVFYNEFLWKTKLLTPTGTVPN